MTRAVSELADDAPDSAADASSLPLSSSIAADTTGEAVKLVCRAILDQGIEYRSSAQSMNAHKRIREIFNCAVAVRAPARRVPRLSGGVLAFSPGLAAARFLYLLSGSDSYPQIAFYTNGASRFAVGGESLPGSAYGARLFGPQENAFEHAARTLMQRPNTKRASIPIFQPHDAAAALATPDLPCAFGLHFLVRDAGMISSATMRANDAFKLLAYNLFEFSLLGECMAARVGAAHAAHVHTSVSMHLRDDGIAGAARLAPCRVADRATPRVLAFDESVREAVRTAEQGLRALGRAPRPDRVLALVPKRLETGPWRDLLLAAALASAAAEGSGEPAAEMMEAAIAAEMDALPLTACEIARQLGTPD